jgi:maleate isomerase
MSVEYAPKGLIGVFTPQANTTVEPEMAILTPPGYAWINARMLSGKATISERLFDYMDQFPDALRQFANAPVDVVALACTGSSYLIGHEREDALLAEITRRSGAPALSGASASVDALNRLGARRIALVSPYNSALDQESAGYWTSRGFEVAEEVSAYRESAAFHPIYSLSGSSADEALSGLADQDIDAVLILGTGMPTLGAIARRPMVGSAPVLSCMLCLAWRAVAFRDPAADSRGALLDWVQGAHWRDRLEQRQDIRA